MKAAYLTHSPLAHDMPIVHGGGALPSLPQHLAERLHGDALGRSDRCRSGSIIRQRSTPCACRLGGMQTADGMVALVRINSRKFGCQVAEPQRSHEDASTECYA
jgi:hypothetical protein